MKSILAVTTRASRADVFELHTITCFRDGEFALALHREQSGQAETTARLGYPNVEEMNKEHDLLHSMLANMLDLPYSPTLWDVAHNIPANELHYAEEEAVLAIQKFWNLARK